MAYMITYWPAADDALRELEDDPAMEAVLRAVNRVEEQLAEDPFNPRLGTTIFMTQALGGISATPARMDDWYLLWQRSPEPMTIEMVHVCQLPQELPQQT